jgi:8-amino-7-oxononanoate synthase
MNSKSPRNGRVVRNQPEEQRDATRKKSRASFLQPFESLLEQINASRDEDLYPFFSSADPSGCCVENPVVLVANDYLGLAGDERVRQAAQAAIAELGTSRCASPLAGGHTALHREFEANLASFLKQEAVAVFASGYQANVGVISALMRREDLILTDLFNHASIVDGARLSGADVRYFQHNSPTHLERILSQEAEGRRVLVIVEGIYSADGDIVRLPELCEVAHRHGALVMIDEAHSLGVLGKNGGGAAEHFDLLEDVDLIVGTMSKTLASVGGFVAADRNLVDAIGHSARALIFSAALPPAGVAAALKSLEILQAEPQRREKLWQNAQLLLDGLSQRGFDTMRSETPVIPIRIGDPMKTIEFAARLRRRGILVCPAIPPMVQSHLSRIRAHVTAGHDPRALEAALPVIEETARSLDLLGKRPETSAPTPRVRAHATVRPAQPSVLRPA